MAHTFTPASEKASAHLPMLSNVCVILRSNSLRAHMHVCALQSEGRGFASWALVRRYWVMLERDQRRENGVCAVLGAVLGAYTLRWLRHGRDRVTTLDTGRCAWLCFLIDCHSSITLPRFDLEPV